MAKRRIVTAFATLLAVTGAVEAQELLHQPRENATPLPLSPELRTRLADPFFRIVLQTTPQPASLNEMVAALTKGASAGFRTFVVGEQISRPETALPDAAPGCGSTPLRRLVLAFTGQHANGEVLDSNVFASVFVTPDGVGGDIEVMGWDAVNGTYNYYKRQGGSWRFRNSSSELADAATGGQTGTCLACHVNGGPVMKEFSFPWNNWNSFAFEAGYLTPASAAPWPVATDPLLAGHLTSAEQLETTIQGSLQRFTDRALSDRITRAADGSVTVPGLRGLLDSLFVPTELNLASSPQISGLDGGRMTQPTTRPIPIPDTFFVDALKLSDLGIDVEDFTPPELAMSVEEYAGLLEDFAIDTGCLPGRDTVFAWFGPEPSEFDRRMAERLVRRGVIDASFAAAVLAVDPGTPLFSDARAGLLAHVPDEVSAPDMASLPTAVRQAALDSLTAVPVAERSEAEVAFLAMLESSDAVGALGERVAALREGLQADLDPTDAPRREATLERLYGQLVGNRKRFAQSPVSARLSEFPGLLPLPAED